MLDEGFMAQARANTIQKEREDVYAALQYAASFHCLVEEWKDCEELKPPPKEKWIFVDKKREVAKHQTEWCATQMSMHEMWKRQQVHEDAKEMCRTEILGDNFKAQIGKIGKAACVKTCMMRRVDREKF